MAAPNGQRRIISFSFVILLGLVIGIFIKKVHYGLLIGLVLGLIGTSLRPRK
jgi:hypothetical protein